MNSIKNNKPFSYPPLCPVTSVEASIADGLGDVVGLDVCGVVEVGDGNIRDFHLYIDVLLAFFLFIVVGLLI